MQSPAQLASFAESEPPSPEAPPRRAGQARLPDETLRQLYACWFESPYPYMFEEPGPRSRPLPIKEIRAGQFMAGISGIMDYGSLSRCAEPLTQTSKSSYSAIEPIEALAQMEIRTDVHKHAYKPGLFNSYYPQVVRWGAGALVPDPQLEIIEGWTAKELYDSGFSRFFRLMAHSYMELVSADSLHTDTERYLAATLGGEDGINWLHNHYAGRLMQYRGFYDGTQMTPGMAFGFWLRRDSDGSALELWLALRGLLRQYDGDWLAQRRAQHLAPRLWSD